MAAHSNTAELPLKEPAHVADSSSLTRLQCCPWGPKSFSTPYSLFPTPCLFRERHQIRVRQLNRSTCLLHLSVEQLCIHNLQQRLRPQYIHIARHLRQFPQLLRNQHPALRVHLCHLSVKVRHVQKLLPYRVHRGHLRQRCLDLLPFLQRINLRPLPVHARDVELGPVQLIHPAFELGRELKPALFINASWVISPKHIYLDTARLKLGPKLTWHRRICLLRVQFGHQTPKPSTSL